MNALIQATDALNRAKGVNKGLNAVVSLVTATDEALENEAIGELLWAMHDQMKRHLDEVDKALVALNPKLKVAA